MMFKEDREFSNVNQRGAFITYDVIANIPQQRFEEYQALLSKLKLGGISRGESTGNIYLAVWNEPDFPYGGSNEYYVYQEWGPPADAGYLTDSLDDLRKLTDSYAFKKIADKWYLHVDNW